MVANLLANALSHGDRSQPVRVSLLGARDEVVLSVQNGGTIPPDELAHLFDPFRTAHGSKTRSQGLGLGLYIVQQLVLAHQGTLSVTSTAEGTSFQVSLPRVG
jgi:signal transduction histidine kinase